MPSFTTDGPEIPIEVLQALEDGELVFFCGAGVSKPAGLPLFGGLVKAIYECVHEEMMELEEKAFENGEHDRVLTLLERRVGAIQVRSAIATVFKRSFNGNLEVHRNLLRLSRTPAGSHRLVTTNFDDVFQRAGALENHIDVAPRLRSPKPAGWHTVVHLHGRLVDQVDPTYGDLVLTSEDFGQAYMLDGWATRFVVELFRNFTVVFVGYSLNDPVMRYMVDALAAARSRGEDFKNCYAFAAYEGETGSSLEAEWKAKGVCAIAYKTSPTHHHLYESLKELADLQEEGLTSKRRLALRFANSPPVDAHDPIGRLVTWALSDPSGKVAEAFASADPAPSLGWLRHIEEAGLLGLTNQKSGREREGNLLAPWTVGATASRLSDVTIHLARWLARHLNDPELARWVISNDCVLHPDFRRFIYLQLKENDALPSDLREFWRIVASEGFTSLLLRYHNVWYFHELLEADSSTADAPRIADLLRLVPALSYDDFPWNRVFADASTEGSEEEGDSDVSVIWRSVNLELKLVSGDASFAVIKKACSNQQLLVALVPRLTQNLIDAWDWQLAFHKIDRHEDYSYIDLESISPHPQSHSFQDWVKIVALLRDGFILLAERDLHRAKVIAEVWREADYPIFHRLCLFAMAEVDGMVRSSDVATYIKRYPHVVFAHPCEREVLRFFRKRSGILSKKAIEQVCDQILKGLDRTRYRTMSDDEWECMNGGEVWKRLVAVALAGAPLPPRAKAELERLQGKYGWTLAPGNQDEFPVWHKKGWVDEATTLPIEELRRRTSHELVTFVTHPPDEGIARRTWSRYAVFGQLVKERPSKVVRVFLQLARSGRCPSGFVSVVLDGFNGEGLGRLHTSHWRYAGMAMAALQDDCLRECALDAARWLRSAPDHVRAIGIEAWWALWDRLWSVSQQVARSGGEGEIDRWVGLAINHPSGVLAEVLLARLWSLELRTASGIPNEVADRFDIMLSGETLAHRLARVILASRLPQLFQLDQRWAAAKLIPLMHIGSKEETPGLWQGYLWAPRLWPDLLMAIKGPLLEALAHSSTLGGEYGSQLRRLFTFACLEVPHGFSDAEVQSSLRALSCDELTDVVWVLGAHLEQAADRAEEQWTKRVRPFIDRCWPRDMKHRSPAVSAAFADLVLKTGNAFPSAVAATDNFLIAMRDSTILLYQLREAHSDLVEAFPDAVLKLLHLTTSQENGSHYGLREVLARLVVAKPRFRTDRRFQQLEKVA
jgi:hypothetical protein